MEFLVLFLMAYGICFGLMNDKAWFLTDRLKKIPFRVIADEDGDKTTFFERMLVCPYCTGFHAGWISWLVLRLPHSLPFTSVTDVLGDVVEVLGVAFASAAFCYIADTFAQYLEDSSVLAKHKVDEE